MENRLKKLRYFAGGTEITEEEHKTILDGKREKRIRYSDSQYCEPLARFNDRLKELEEDS